MLRRLNVITVPVGMASPSEHDGGNAAVGVGSMPDLSNLNSLRLRVLRPGTRCAA